MTRRFADLCILAVLGCDPVEWPTKDTGDSREESDTDTDTDTDADADADADADTDADADADTDSDYDPDRSPEVTFAEAYCYRHEVGTTYDQWILSAQADDPQGLFTLQSSGEVAVRDASGTPKATYALACNLDTGACSGAFHDYDDGILCDSASSYTFAFRVQDEDDLWSVPVRVNGENRGR